jgi:hypothetical protein
VKSLFIIIITFVIAFTTSALLNLEWIAANNVRYILVILLIAVELLAGFLYLKSQITIPNLENE